ncbi:hypothetical protein EAE96_008541 [Botrytis aclada]|nr:hypothetical protein EAE96_008541 [Botrytis aclada]
MSGQNNRDQDWATPRVARRWLHETLTPQSHRPRKNGTSSRLPRGENLTPTHFDTEPQVHRSDTQLRTSGVPDEDSIMTKCTQCIIQKRERARKQLAFPLGSDIWVRKLSVPPPFLHLLLYNITNLNQSAVNTATRHNGNLFPTHTGSKRLWNGRYAENDKNDAFVYFVNSENARFPYSRRQLRSRKTSRGGSVRGGAPIRRGKPARGGSYNSGFFTPGRFSHSRMTLGRSVSMREDIKGLFVRLL